MKLIDADKFKDYLDKELEEYLAHEKSHVNRVMMRVIAIVIKNAIDKQPEVKVRRRGIF